MQNKNNKIIIIAGGSAGFLLLVGLVVYLTRFVRYMGEMPYLWDPSFNQTLLSYTKTRPSRYVLALTGGYKTGKSTAMNLIAKYASNSQIFPIVVDFDLANSLQDCIDIFKLQLLQTFSKGSNKLDNSNLKALADLHLYDYLADRTTESLPNPAFRTPYSAITNALNSITKHGFNEYGVHRVLQVLAYYEPVFHFTIFIHNYDKIYQFENGEKITNAALSYLVNNNQYINYLPIIVEVKNSYRRFNISRSVEYLPIPAFNAQINELVNKRYFRRKEANLILNQIGPNPGPFAEIHRAIRYGKTFEEAFEQAISRLDKYVESVADDKIRSETLPAFCKNGAKVVGSQKDIESIYPLFEKGLLVINNDLKIESGLPYSSKKYCK